MWWPTLLDVENLGFWDSTYPRGGKKSREFKIGEELRDPLEVLN